MLQCLLWLKGLAVKACHTSASVFWSFWGSCQRHCGPSAGDGTAPLFTYVLLLAARAACASRKLASMANLGLPSEFVGTTSPLKLSAVYRMVVLHVLMQVDRL